jgi:hypothetical protein
MPSAARQKSILIRLADAGVEAIVVGMTSAVIQGVPTTTWDLDIVHKRRQNVIVMASAERSPGPW